MASGNVLRETGRRCDGARVPLGHERLEVHWVGRGLSPWDVSGEFGVRLRVVNLSTQRVSNS